MFYIKSLIFSLFHEILRWLFIQKCCCEGREQGGWERLWCSGALCVITSKFFWKHFLKSGDAHSFSFLKYCAPHAFFLTSCQQELHADIQSQYLPDMLSVMLQALRSHMDTASLDDVTQSMRACFKVLSKIQMPVAYMDVEAEVQADDTEVQSKVDEAKKNQVWPLKS